ncbi:hypothetical protein J7I80_06930 [Bacillus sp. ISL-41]|nr:hypothetical protein [Bacillus sp. ISL-41]
MEVDIKDLKQGQNGLEVDIKDLKQGLYRLEVDIKDLKQGQNRLEIGQEKLQKNLVDSLGFYTDKIVEHIDDKTEALNKRVYKVETEIERLSRQ